MMSVNKMLALGLAALTGSYLVGCKDDDDDAGSDACSNIAQADLASNVACQECYWKKLDYPACASIPAEASTDECLEKISTWGSSLEPADQTQAFTDCGGSVDSGSGGGAPTPSPSPSGACTNIAQAELATNVACQECYWTALDYPSCASIPAEQTTSQCIGEIATWGSSLAPADITQAFTGCGGSV